MHSIRHWISFFTGLLILLLGLLPLIGKAALLGPMNSLPGTILAYILAFGGLFVIVDSFFEFSFHSGVGIATLIIGLLVFALGLLMVLGNHGVLSFKIGFLTTLIYNILFILEGLFLMIGCFIMD